jgi:hypothetical protein
MFWIKKLNWWFEIKTRKTILLKKKRFFIQLHFYMLYKKNLKYLKKFYSKIHGIFRLKFFHNWQLVNILKKRKFRYLCLCTAEEFFFNKNIQFFNTSLYSKKNREKKLLKFQFYNNIPIYFRLIFSITFFLNSKFTFTSKNLLGINLNTFFLNFDIKSLFVRIKNKLLNNFLFNKLKSLSFIGFNNFDENFFFFPILKKYTINLQSRHKFNLIFSIFLNTLFYNSKIGN